MSGWNPISTRALAIASASICVVGVIAALTAAYFEIPTLQQQVERPYVLAAGLVMLALVGINWLHMLIFKWRLEAIDRAGLANNDKCMVRAPVVFRKSLLPMLVFTLMQVALFAFMYFDDMLARATLTVEAPSTTVTRFGIAQIEVAQNLVVPIAVVIFAFWGAFLFTNLSFVRRTINNDLHPAVWVFAAVRLAASVLAAVLTYAAAPDFWANSAGTLVVTAFFAGMFPLRLLQMLYRWLTGRLTQQFGWLGKYIQQPLTVLDGVTLEVEDRLLEAGVDSVQAIATADAQELMDPNRYGLPFPQATLEDWIDQAKLALYFYDEQEFAALRGIGLRSASNVREYQAKVIANPAILDSVDPSPIKPDRFKHFILYGKF